MHQAESSLWCPCNMAVDPSSKHPSDPRVNTYCAGPPLLSTLAAGGSQALDAGSSAAIPEGIRQELERIEDAGGLRFLQDLVAQVKVRHAGIVLLCTFRPISKRLLKCDRGSSNAGHMQSGSISAQMHVSPSA